MNIKAIDFKVLKMNNKIKKIGKVSAVTLGGENPPWIEDGYWRPVRP